MILGIGTDIVEVGRVRGALDRTRMRLSHRLLAPIEVEYLQQLPPARQAEYTAGRFAAKEAIGKALGIGLGRLRPNRVAVVLEKQGLTIQWLGSHEGQPYTRDIWHLSISHTESTAMAMAVWERIEGG